MLKNAEKIKVQIGQKKWANGHFYFQKWPAKNRKKPSICKGFRVFTYVSAHFPTYFTQKLFYSKYSYMHKNRIIKVFPRKKWVFGQQVKNGKFLDNF